MAVKVKHQLRISVYAWLIKFFYKRLTAICTQVETKPVGIPLQRDPNAPCEYYEPVPRGQFKFGDCESDGHYLCNKCCHLSQERRQLNQSGQY